MNIQISPLVGGKLVFARGNICIHTLVKLYNLIIIIACERCIDAFSSMVLIQVTIEECRLRMFKITTLVHAYNFCFDLNIKR